MSTDDILAVSIISTVLFLILCWLFGNICFEKYIYTSTQNNETYNEIV